MMISPDQYISELQDKTYDELLEEKRALIQEIDKFEQSGYDATKPSIVSPSPDVAYQCNLEYLAALCKLIAEKFQRANLRFN